MHETREGGASWLWLFGISLQIQTEVTSPNIADTTFKELLPTVGPAILSLMNISLSTGIVPSSFKAAVIWRLLKTAWFLPHRTQFVLYECSESKHYRQRFGVPKGSVLDQLVFAIYMLPLGDVICSFGISFHCYADDSQHFIPVESGDSAQMQKVESCLAAVKSWMSQNFLQLNIG